MTKVECGLKREEESEVNPARAHMRINPTQLGEQPMPITPIQDTYPKYSMQIDLDLNYNVWCLGAKTRVI